MQQKKALGFQLALAGTAHDLDDQVPPCFRVRFALLNPEMKPQICSFRSTCGLFRTLHKVRDSIELLLFCLPAVDPEATETHLQQTVRPPVSNTGKRN